jgi:hypothetical protein
MKGGLKAAIPTLALLMLPQLALGDLYRASLICEDEHLTKAFYFGNKLETCAKVAPSTRSRCKVQTSLGGADPTFAQAYDGFKYSYMYRETCDPPQRAGICAYSPTWKKWYRVALGSCHDTGLEAVITVVKEVDLRRGLRGETLLADVESEDEDYDEEYSPDSADEDIGE